MTGHIAKAELPYGPSWIDRIHQTVNRLPIPYLLFYLILWLVYLFVLTILRWRDQTFPRGHFEATDIIMAGTGIFFIALVHYLDEWAGSKLVRFRDAIHVSDEQFDVLQYQISTLPARQTLIVSLIMLGFGVVTFALLPGSYAFIHIDLASPSGLLQLLNFFFSWFTFGALCFHAYHQLRLGSLATANYLNINLFNLSPVYTFAGLTLRTALGWLVVAYAWALSTPDLINNVIIISTILFMQVVAVLTFILPLMSTHGRIVEKKSQLLAEIGSRMELTVNEMSTASTGYDTEMLTRLKELLATLTLAEERIQRISTWPWRAGAFNSLATAILLPNLVWLLQNVAGQYFFR